MKNLRINLIYYSLILAFLSPIIIGLEGCVTNPATGENEFSLLSRAEEIALGQEADAQIVAEFGVYDDPQLQAWVDGMGQKIAAVSDDPDLVYTFRILDSEVINAFALPGGFVYVTRGLLAYLENDAQLAMVLGHEIGHITARHSAKQYTNQVLAGLGLGLGSVLFEDIRPFLGTIETGMQLLFLSYSRDNETQSDTLGVKYATLAGYEAAEGAEFFVTLQRLQEQQGTTIPTWASTHPNPANREQNIIQRAAEWKAARPDITLGGINPEVYIPRLENLTFGQNPRHGFVQNNTFYHPDLTFQFPVPSGWSVANYATQVQMVSQDERAIALMTTSNTSSPSAAAAEFRGGQGITALEQANDNINGFPAVRLRSNIQTNDGILGVLSYFIQKDGVIYVFHGYTAQAQLGVYLSTFEGIFRNFAQLTNSSILAVQPYRLDAFTAPRTDVFSSLVGANPNVGLDIEGMAILNQRQVNEQVTQGAHLKEIK